MKSFKTYPNPLPLQELRRATGGKFMMPQMTEMMWIWTFAGILLIVLLVIAIARLRGK